MRFFYKDASVRLPPVPLCLSTGIPPLHSITELRLYRSGILEEMNLYSGSASFENFCALWFHTRIGCYHLQIPCGTVLITMARVHTM